MASEVLMLIRCFALFTFASLPAFVFPVPAGAKVDEPTMNYPTEVGTKWVYGRPDGGEFICTITAREEKDDCVLFSDEEEVKPDKRKIGKHVQLMKFTNSGIYRYGFDKTIFDTPECKIALPVADRKSWEWQIAGTAAKRVYTTLGVEEVEVPAGTYQAVKVECVCELASGEFKTDYWYTSGVGLVKEELTLLVTGRVSTYVLKKFIHGKR